LNTAESRNPEIVYKCHNVEQAVDLSNCLSQLFPQLFIGWQHRSLDIYARQGLKQSIHDYIFERQELRSWLSHLADHDGSKGYKQHFHDLALSMLERLEQKPKNIQEEARKLRGLLQELITLKNEAGFWLVCRQIRALEAKANQA
jgi:hypothetical protein